MLRAIKTAELINELTVGITCRKQIHLRPSAYLQKKKKKILFYFYESGTTWLQASQKQFTKLSYSLICMSLIKLHSSVGYILHLVPPAE